jgi:hypothetical protein
MDYTELIDSLNTDNKTYIHLHSNALQSTHSFNLIQNTVSSFLKKKQLGGIHFNIESTNSSLEENYFAPIIQIGVGEDLNKIYTDTLVSLSVPSRIGVLISSVDRPFLGYKSLALFPHNMVRFDYIVMYRGWDEDKKIRHTFMSVFNCFSYVIDYEDDNICIAKGPI